MLMLSPSPKGNLVTDVADSGKRCCPGLKVSHLENMGQGGGVVMQKTFPKCGSHKTRHKPSEVDVAARLALAQHFRS